MPTVSLMSFLNIMTKSAPQKVREYQRYLTPGGYDFYWQLKDAAAALTYGGKSFEQCLAPLHRIKRDSERKHNVQRLEALQRWLSRAECSYFEPPRATCQSPLGHLKIKLEPEFGVVVGSRKRLVHLWSNQGTNLKAFVAGGGIYLMQQHLLKNGFDDCECVILDLKKSYVFASDGIPANVIAMTNSELAWADSFFHAAAEAA
ncbi:MAG TPA: hypothetical protein VFB45_06855 [Pseudolabrys sp.]|nr:hypothetical protein [Pseudolabrys sp.]